VTIFIDDAGSGDLLLGVVIGVYNSMNDDFRYDVIDVKYFQSNLFQNKAYLNEAAQIVFSLLSKMKIMPPQDFFICQGYIFNKAVNMLRKYYGADQVHSLKVVGKPQKYVEQAYLDELRNLGYTPLQDRQKKRAKSFFHMMRWLKKHPKMIQYAKTGWPRLTKYPLFNSIFHHER
jgi:hypothetical protein